MKTNYLFLLLVSCAPLLISAQEETGSDKRKKKNFEPNTAILIAPTYTAQFPFGNMGDRFGFNNLIGLNLSYKIKKNWIIGLDGNFLFGTKVREDYVLDKISTSTGQFIGTDNSLIKVRGQERGGVLKVVVGKIIPFSEKYPDAGLMLQTGLGFIQHKIAIDVRENLLPQLNKTYRKGYDRMANGFVMSQFIGGAFMERKKFYSFYGGFQVDVAFTEGRRAYDFFNQAPLNDKRIDVFVGFKLGWVIPIFLQASEKEYYYY